ncbi:outer membrane beta-barrel protein [Polynucleobacter paneuropaeus]|nr:outer membrane beta-barrel protein [Polynucleobacter paneuropaeus]
MKKILISILLTLSASPLIAQSAFEGFYGQISTGYEKNSYSSINPTWSVSNGINGITGSGSAPNQSSSGAPLILGVGYNYAVSNEYLVGIGFDYSALSQNTSNFSQSSINSGGATATIANMSYKVSNRMNLFLTPSYAINSNSLVYFKAGYSLQQLQYSQGADADLGLTSGFNSSKNVNGYILGLGYKQFITNGLYGFVEGNYMSYSSSSISGTGMVGGVVPITFITSPSLNAYNLLVGVGYKF